MSGSAAITIFLPEKAKPYQVKQVRHMILKYKLEV